MSHKILQKFFLVSTFLSLTTALISAELLPSSQNEKIKRHHHTHHRTPLTSFEIEQQRRSGEEFVLNNPPIVLPNHTKQALSALASDHLDAQHLDSLPQILSLLNMSDESLVDFQATLAGALLRHNISFNYQLLSNLILSSTVSNKWRLRLGEIAVLKGGASSEILLNLFHILSDSTVSISQRAHFAANVLFQKHTIPSNYNFYLYGYLRSHRVNNAIKAVLAKNLIQQNIDCSAHSTSCPHYSR